jgi:hypothetical protein
MVVTHAVVNYGTVASGQGRAGGPLQHAGHERDDSVAADGSSNVAVTADIHDTAALQAAMASPSPEDMTAEERHGVIQPITA